MTHRAILQVLTRKVFPCNPNLPCLPFCFLIFNNLQLNAPTPCRSASSTATLSTTTRRRESSFCSKYARSLFENLKYTTCHRLKLHHLKFIHLPFSGDLQSSDRHGSKVLGPVVHLPDWGFIILFFQENLDKHFPRFHFFKKFLKNIFYVSMYFFQESSHPFHPLLGRGGSGQGDGVHQEPEGIQDLLPGVWDMIGKCWIADSALQNTDAHTTFKYSIVKSTWHLFAQFIEGYLIQYINRSTR